MKEYKDYVTLGVVMTRQDFDKMREHFKDSDFERYYIEGANIKFYTDDKKRKLVGLTWDDEIYFHGGMIQQFFEFLNGCSLYSGIIVDEDQGIEYIENPITDEDSERLDTPFKITLSYL